MIGERYESRTRLSVLKIRAGQKFTVALLRSEALGHIVHWLGSNSVMCAGKGCPACMASLGGRWVGVMPARLLGADNSRRPVLVEFSGEAWSALDGLLRMAGVEDRVGVVVELSRRRSRGGLLAEPCCDTPPESVRAMPDHLLLDALATLYGLPRCMPEWSVQEWEEKVASSVQSRLVRAMEFVPTE